MQHYLVGHAFLNLGFTQHQVLGRDTPSDAQSKHEPTAHLPPLLLLGGQLVLPLASCWAWAAAGIVMAVLLAADDCGGGGGGGGAPTAGGNAVAMPVC